MPAFSISTTDPFRCHPRFLASLPRVVRLYIFNCLIGFALSAMFTGAIIWLDVAGIGHLVLTVPGGMLAGLVFFVLNGIVFAGVQTGIVVMSLARDDDDRSGGRRMPLLVRQPVAVPALAPRAGRRPGRK